MINATEIPIRSTAAEKAAQFDALSAAGWRMAAERRERIGDKVTALMFRNEAYVLEHPEETWFKIRKDETVKRDEGGK